MSLVNMTPEALLALGSNVASIIGNDVPNPFGTTPAQYTALNLADTGLTNAINGQKAADTAAKAATVNKANKKAALVAALASVQATVTTTPAVTNVMLAELGFPPRRGGSRPQPRTPIRVADLVATAVDDGTVRLKWTRGANAYGTMFVVETSADGAEWTMIKSTTRVSYVAEGFAPGAAAWFRVTATTSVASSTPSAPVAVYAPAAPAKVQLKLAA